MNEKIYNEVKTQVEDEQIQAKHKARANVLEKYAEYMWEKEKSDIVAENRKLKIEILALKQRIKGFKAIILLLIILAVCLVPAAVKTFADTEFKAWEPYTAITARDTLNYKLTREATYDKYGLMIHGNYYLVALGNGWGKVGDCFTVTLSSGVQFKIMMADEKANSDTDARNRYDRRNGSVLEFIINPYALDSRIKRSGSVGTVPEFSGSVVSIEYMGRLA